jgi:hypothetical protein
MVFLYMFKKKKKDIFDTVECDPPIMSNYENFGQTK